MPLETPQALPLTLVHGTFWRHWPSILLKGLSCRGRTHIHLAPGLPGDPGVISGQCPSPATPTHFLLPGPSPKDQATSRHSSSCPRPLYTLRGAVTPSPHRARDLPLSLPKFGDCHPERPRSQLQLSPQAFGQIAKWPCSSMGPWPWQVSLDTAGTALGLQRRHESHLRPCLQTGSPSSALPTE